MAGEGKGTMGNLAATLYGLQDFLLGVAARLEGTQQRVSDAKDAVLQKRREVCLLGSEHQADLHNHQAQIYGAQSKSRTASHTLESGIMWQTAQLHYT